VNDIPVQHYSFEQVYHDTKCAGRAMCVPQGELLPISAMVLTRLTGLYCWDRKTLIVETEAEVSAWDSGEVDGLPRPTIEAFRGVNVDAIMGDLEAKASEFRQRVSAICAERWPDIQPERKL
jgi:hypothetical protein